MTSNSSPELRSNRVSGTRFGVFSIRCRSVNRGIQHPPDGKVPAQRSRTLNSSCWSMSDQPCFGIANGMPALQSSHLPGFLVLPAWNWLLIVRPDFETIVFRSRRGMQLSVNGHRIMRCFALAPVPEMLRCPAHEKYPAWRGVRYFRAEQAWGIRCRRSC